MQPSSVRPSRLLPVRRSISAVVVPIVARSTNEGGGRCGTPTAAKEGERDDLSTTSTQRHAIGKSAHRGIDISTCPKDKKLNFQPTRTAVYVTKHIHKQRVPPDCSSVPRVHPRHIFLASKDPTRCLPSASTFRRHRRLVWHSTPSSRYHASSPAYSSRFVYPPSSSFAAEQDSGIIRLLTGCLYCSC